MSCFVVTIRGLGPLRRTLAIRSPDHTGDQGVEQEEPGVDRAWGAPGQGVVSPQQRQAATWDLVLHQGRCGWDSVVRAEPGL